MNIGLYLLYAVDLLEPVSNPWKLRRVFAKVKQVPEIKEKYEVNNCQLLATDKSTFGLGKDAFDQFDSF
jgi:hypothetical protein